MRSARLNIGKWAAGILVGGIVLGALLGSAADPDMKDAPEPWWQQSGRDDAVAEADPVLFEDRRTVDAPGGFRPDLDYDAEVWSVMPSDYELAAMAEDPFADEPFAEEPSDGGDEANAESAADDAERAVEDAEAAREIDAPPATTVRKSELAVAGLY